MYPNIGGSCRIDAINVTIRADNSRLRLWTTASRAAYRLGPEQSADRISKPFSFGQAQLHVKFVQDGCSCGSISFPGSAVQASLCSIFQMIGDHTIRA